MLINLNGHTPTNTLPYMLHRPAKLQAMYLGLPTTTGLSFLDYYIGGYVSILPDSEPNGGFE